MREHIGPDDERYMKQALELARKGLGDTYPNPAVGCVIVCDGRTIGRGYHRRDFLFVVRRCDNCRRSRVFDRRIIVFRRFSVRHGIKNEFEDIDDEHQKEKYEEYRSHADESDLQAVHKFIKSVFGHRIICGIRDSSSEKR